MKKRIISMLLTVLMVMSLFSGLTVGADAANYNGANVIEYTMAQGDFVLRICQRLGLNYYTCKNAIMILNNITDGQWNKLTVGRTLLLPASDYDALLISNGAGTSVYNSGAASTTATTSNVTGTATVGNAAVLNTAAAVAAASSDTLAYYLVPYTMSYGETVSGVCNALGVNFSIFSPFIKQVNNISNWNRVRAGDTLIIPTPVAPSVGTTCYGVMEHIVAGSDTAYGIVSSKGVNYNANERLLKVLNQTDNLAAIKAGGKFFYPVPLTVSVPGTGNPGATSTTTTTTTVTDGNGTTTTSTTTTAKLYKLTGGLAASDGLMLFYVDNKAVTAAPAGAKVTVVTQTNSGKAIQSLTVKHLDGTADLFLSGDTFVMPSCDVRVDGTVKNGHDINIIANYSGKATASVGGISVMSAVKGAPVIIKSSDPNYEISSVYATYKKLISASTKTVLTVSSSNAFIMPDADVDVEVVLKPVTTYAFYVNDPANGSFYLQVNGSAVSRAAKGAQVTVVAKGDAGYEPSALEVKNRTTGAQLNVFSNTFTMPASDVEVAVKFAPKGNNIVVMPAQNANVYAFTAMPGSISTDILEKMAVNEAPNGEMVYLVAVDEETNPASPSDIDESKYTISYDIVRNSDGLKVNPEHVSAAEQGSLKNGWKFKMPKGGVTVTPVIVARNNVTVKGTIVLNGTTVSKYSDCSFTVSYKISGKDKRVEFNADKPGVSAQIPTFEYVDLRYDGAEGVAFVKYRILVDGAGPETSSVAELITNEANLHNYFQIPDGKEIVIEAYFESGKVAMGPAVITGTGSVSYKVLKNGSWMSVNTCNPDDDVLLVVTPGIGYKFSDDKYDARLFVTRKDNGAPITVTKVGPSIYKDLPTDGTTYAYSFKMPAAGVDVRAVFDPKPFIITMKCVDEAGRDLTGYGLWQAAIDWVPGIGDNATAIDPSTGTWTEFVTTFEASYGDYVTVAMTEAGWSKYDMVSFRIDDREYTADELNYFYNFQMIDNRAKNLTITAVLRPKNVTAPHNLNAVYDMSKGSVEFLILESASGYSKDYVTRTSGSQIVSSQFVKRAFGGDKIGIAATVNDGKYGFKPEDIVINSYGGDEDRIVPKMESYYYVDGSGRTINLNLYTFYMPDSDVIVTIPFSGDKYSMTVVVEDASGKPVNGMINLTAGAQTFGDAATDSSFGGIEYNALVTVLRSMLAVSENKVITKVDVRTNPGSNPVYYFDYSVGGIGGNGPAFNMPASNVTIYVTIDDLTPVNVVNFQDRLTGGSLIFRSGPALTDPIVTEFNVGDTVYVFEVPDAGYGHLGKGDLNITNNGTVYTVANWHAEAADGTNVWKFKVPNGITVFTATWGKLEDAPAEENLIYAPAEAIVGGTVSFSQGSNPTTSYVTGTDLTITVKPDAGYGYPTQDEVVVKDVNGNIIKAYGADGTYVIPGSTLPEGGISVSVECPLLKVTINFKLKSSSPASARLTLNGIDQFIEDDSNHEYQLNPGDIVVITSANSAYNAVTVDSVFYNGVKSEQASVNYVVPGKADTVEITLTSTAPAVTLKDMTNGTVNLRKEDITGKATDDASNFKVDEEIYIQVVPAYGYRLKEGSLKVVENVDETKANKIGTKGTTGFYPITSADGKIPVGGITISAEFEPETIVLNFNTTATGAIADVVVANVSTGNGLGTGNMQINTTFGQTITVIPADGFEWASNAFTVTNGNGEAVSVSGTSARGTRSFKVESVHKDASGAVLPYTIVLNLVPTA